VINAWATSFLEDDYAVRRILCTRAAAFRCGSRRRDIRPNEADPSVVGTAVLVSMMALMFLGGLLKKGSMCC